MLATSARPDRAREQQVEAGGQQETIADQTVRRIEGGIVQHLEIDRAMDRACRMKLGFVDIEMDDRPPFVRDRQFRSEQPVDRGRSVQAFQRAKMRRLSARPDSR